MSNRSISAGGALALGTLGLLLPWPSTPAGGLQAPITRAQSFGIAVTMPGVNHTSPLAQLTAGEPMASDQASNVSVSGLATAENLTAIATGGAPESSELPQSSAESHSTLERVRLLNGLITADALVAVASSAIRGTTASSDTEGSQLANVRVNGVAAPAEPAPNTRVDIPGVGYVVLNEQIQSGDGLTSSGITVNLIHVFLQTGEIIAGSASSFVSR